MEDKTEKLIERLVADGRQVRRLRPPTIRAGLWLLAVGAFSVLGIALFANLEIFTDRIHNLFLAIEMIATLVTGVTAVLAAFQLSLPDRSVAWGLLPLPSLAVWIGSSGYSCFRHWLTFGPDGWELGESTSCFVFILLFSVPLALSLLVVLRRAAPLTPVRVAAMGALGVAALAAAALQFFHPFDVTFLDLSVHLLTITLVVVGASAVEYFADRGHMRESWKVAGRLK